MPLIIRTFLTIHKILDYHLPLFKQLGLDSHLFKVCTDLTVTLPKIYTSYTILPMPFPQKTRQSC